MCILIKNINWLFALNVRSQLLEIEQLGIRK